MAIDKSKFRASGNNNRLLKALFFEQVGEDKSSVVYTLKDVDHEGFSSMYRLYMEIDDPTEWEVSQQLVDGWEHWEMLCNCSWFKPFIERWRKELELRYKSKALVKIRSEAKAGGRDAFQANKYLLEKAWEPKEAKESKRGRPTKDDIKKAADELAKAENRLLDDFNRITSLN